MLKKEIAKIEHKTKKKNSSSFIQEEVTSEEIAKCVSQWTGIPVERMLENPYFLYPLKNKKQHCSCCYLIAFKRLPG